MVNGNMDAVFGSLSDPTRRDILLRLATSRLTVGQIGKTYGMSPPAISKHLKVLENARLITRERHGRQQFIQLSPAAFRHASAHLRSYETRLNNRLESLEKYLQKEASVNKVKLENDHTVEMPEDEELILTHVFNAPRKKVWDAYTNPAHIAKWWAPVDATVIKCEADVRVGGIWRFTFRSFSNNQIYISSGVFKEISVPQRLVYTDGFGEAIGPRPESIVSVTFEDLPNNRTILTKRLAAAPVTHHLQAALLESLGGAK